MIVAASAATPRLSNAAIASQLESVAELLEAQNANQYRVRAYRAAAATLRELPQPVYEILEIEGIAGLRRLPTIGESLARSIEALVYTGKISLLEQLRGETSQEQVLASVPGIGPKLANRIHEQLGIETLLDLQDAAYDGRLAQVPGFGTRRVRGVRESLAGRLRRPPPLSRTAPLQVANQPLVSELLDVDREYRLKATANKLPRITPRRFNPTREAWLPILHTERDGTHYTALFSNTARAHELGTFHDWVVIYRDDHDGAGQWTIISAHYGHLKGKRIVRGREAECEQYYRGW
jgi:hypothetical protein